MAYDEILANRIRNCLEGVPQASEKKMFGGLCFLVGGNMACGVTNRGYLMVRVGADRYEEALSKPHVRPMDFTGRPLKGLVYIDPEGFRRDADLRNWIDVGVGFAASLPPKG